MPRFETRIICFRFPVPFWGETRDILGILEVRVWGEFFRCDVEKVGKLVSGLKYFLIKSGIGRISFRDLIALLLVGFVIRYFS